MGIGAMAGVAGLALGGAALAATVFGSVKEGFTKAIGQAAQMEQIEISFEVLTGGPDQARALLGELRDLAANTPLKFDDIAGAGRQLLAFKESAETLPATLTKIGDISSAIGAPIGEIAELYGKARIQGTLFAEDINQLTGRGIDVISEFAAQLGVGTDQVKKLASEGKITFPMLEQAFSSLTSEGGMFFQMMQRQSQTVAGLWSTLTDAVTTAYTRFGAPVNDALRPLLVQAVELAGSLGDYADQLGQKVAAAIDFVHAAFRTMSGSEMFSAIGEALELAFMKAIDYLARGVQTVYALLNDTGFTSGIADQLEIAGLRLREVLLNTAAELVESIAGVFPPGLVSVAKTANAANYLRATGDVAAAQREDIQSREGPDLGSLLGQIQERFAEAGGVFGDEAIAAQKAKLDGMLLPVFAEMARIQSERAQGDEAAGAGARVGGEQIATGAGAGGALAGAFQQAKNLIAGKTVNELVAQAAMKTNDQLGKLATSQAATTAAVRDVAKAVRGQKIKADVEVVPVF
jgi:tape measure domain-containing protein